MIKTPFPSSYQGNETKAKNIKNVMLYNLRHSYCRTHLISPDHLKTLIETWKYFIALHNEPAAVKIIIF
jgi:hypothetical protein